jgi:radical SAM enzyme (TIGR01210 family)
VLVEDERRADGAIETAATVFLTGAECPFTCVFCDLWKHTLHGPTPPGALPAQLRRALQDPALVAARPSRIKLYNASNFFDTAAVPRADWPALVDLLQPFAGVTVECHPKLVGPACVELAGLLGGRLEVAMGLETVNPAALARLNKQMTLADFDKAAAFLGRAGLDLRVFVLLGAPFVEPSEATTWCVRSVAHAGAQGARLVAIIPVRGGNGEMERLAAAGHFAPPSLRDLEGALEAALDRAPATTAVIADPWDADRLAACPLCRRDRLDRLARMNRTGRAGERVTCPTCANGPSPA